MTDRAERGWVLSIDFGTTATAAATSADGRVELVEIDGERRMPSMVCWQEAVDGSPGRLLLGDEAENRAILAPQCLERCPKRKLGQEFMLLGSQRMRVTEAIAAIFEHVLEEASRRQGGEPPRELCLTHPARWGERRIGKLREAAAAVGFEQPVLLPEPVGAAIFFAGERLAPGDRVAVYDLGGGTFDTAVLRRTASGFEVVGRPGGRDELGGEDFDYRLYRFLGRQLDPERWQTLTSPDADEFWQRAHYDFKKDVRRAKERLSKSPDATVRTPVPGEPDMPVSASELENLIRDDIEATVDDLQRTIEQAGETVAGLSAIYLAGGSSRIPLVSRRIEERLGVQPTVLGDPKGVIALGAARARAATDGRPAPSRVASGDGSGQPAGEGGRTVERSRPTAEVPSPLAPLSSHAPQATAEVPQPTTRISSLLAPLSSHAPPPTPKVGAVGFGGGALAVLGAILVLASRFLPWVGGSSAWDATYLSIREPIVMTVLCLAVIACAAVGLAHARLSLLYLTAFVGAYLTAVAFPLRFTTYTPAQIGFWLGTAGGALIVLGGLGAADAGITFSGGGEAHTRGASSRASHVLNTLAGIGLVLVVVSLLLPFGQEASAWSAGFVETRYPLTLTILAAFGIALVVLDSRFERRRMLSFAAIVSCFLLGQVFPVDFIDYRGLQVGFWLGVVGALLAVTATVSAMMMRGARGRR